MQINLRDNKKILTTLLVLSFVTALVSLFGVFVSDIVIPVSAALLAVIFLLENDRRKWFSVLVSLIVLAANAVSVLLLDGFIFCGAETVILAGVIAFCFSRDQSKAETAFWMTAVASLFVFVNASAFAMVNEGQFDFQTVKSFYGDFYKLIKEELLNSLSMLSAYLPENSGYTLISSENLVALLNSFVSLMISYIVISGFIVSGITLKVFTFTASRLTTDKEDVINWRFKTGNLFAYFYLALFVLQIFTGGHTGLFAVTVANLAGIFCIVYAYLGFNFVMSLLAQKRSAVFSFIMLLVGLALFSSLMVEILSIVGAFVIISENKSIPKK